MHGGGLPIIPERRCINSRTRRTLHEFVRQLLKPAWRLKARRVEVLQRGCYRVAVSRVVVTRQTQPLQLGPCALCSMNRCLTMAYPRHSMREPGALADLGSGPFF